MFRWGVESLIKYVSNQVSIEVVANTYNPMTALGQEKGESRIRRKWPEEEGIAGRVARDMTP